MRLFFIANALLGLVCFHALAQGVVINEIMAKNHSTIPDMDNDYSDWIEVYNGSTVAVNLENYSLSDDSGDLQKWNFPSVSIAPNGYLLVFASGKNILNVSELHTNFKISTGGEEIYLSDNASALISQSEAVNLITDEAFGQVSDGSGNWIRIATPTPGTSNNASNELFFSHAEGFYTSAFPLVVQSHLTDSIFYTLNGGLPHPGSNLYEDSIPIDENTGPNVFSEIVTTPDQNLISYPAWSSPDAVLDKAVILRCASFNNGVRTSKVYTKSFFVDSEIFDKYSMPVVSLVTESDNLFDDQTGIYVPGAHYNPSDPEWTGNYFASGSNWERDVHIEYFSNDGVLGFAQDAGVRIHGGKTPQAAQKSLRLYARNEYGKESFDYPLLPQKPVNNYKRFILRTTMGSWQETIIGDVVAHDASRQLDLDFQDFQPVIVFLNGEYWGIQTIRDRIDEHYVAYTHNFDSDSVEFSIDAPLDYQGLMDFIEDNPLAVADNYNYVITQIDINNYIDYQIAEQFFANYDWPANNQAMWRKKTAGKWRWVLFDLDAGLMDAEYNMLNHCTSEDPAIFWPNSPASTFLFRKLLENQSFRTRFISRYVEVLNSHFRTAVLEDRIDAVRQLYEPEISGHSERWDFPGNITEWTNAVEQNLLTFVQDRPCAVKQNIMDFFGLSQLNFVCDVDVTEKPEISNLILAPNPNQGQFFVFNDASDILDARITLTDIRGSEVYFDQFGVDLYHGERFNFDLGALSSNVYVLRVASSNFSARLKVVVTN